MHVFEFLCFLETKCCSLIRILHVDLTYFSFLSSIFYLRLGLFFISHFPVTMALWYFLVFCFNASYLIWLHFNFFLTDFCTYNLFFRFLSVYFWVLRRLLFSVRYFSFISQVRNVRCSLPLNLIQSMCFNRLKFEIYVFDITNNFFLSYSQLLLFLQKEKEEVCASEMNNSTLSTMSVGVDCPNVSFQIFVCWFWPSLQSSALIELHCINIVFFRKIVV